LRFFSAAVCHTMADRFGHDAPGLAWNKTPKGGGDKPIAVRRNDRGRKTADFSILGEAMRSPVTGKVHLKHASILRDFAMVDLWERQALYGSAKDLALDPYLFKIVPMPYRTWAYHCYFRDPHELAQGKTDNSILQRVLEETHIDATASGGKWSSAIAYAPAAFIACLTADPMTSLSLATFTSFLLIASVLSNSPGHYRLSRAFMVLPRIFFMIFVFSRMMSLEKGGSGSFHTLAFVLILFCVFADFYGDWQQLWSNGITCTYKVMKILPNRLFICRREGAAFLEDPDYSPVSEVVTGMGSWEPEMCLLVEIRGLVCQLKPLTEEDWTRAFEQRQNSAHSGEGAQPLSFMGLDIFNSAHRTLDEHDLENAIKKKCVTEGMMEMLANKKMAAMQNGLLE